MILTPILLPLLAFAFGPSQNWHKFWKEVPTSELPALAPEGELSAFGLGVERQIENCREFETQHFEHCSSESNPVGLACDVPVLKKLQELALSSRDWTSFYAQAKKKFHWYKFVQGQAEENTLFTGYNAPFFDASLTQDSKHPFPLYRRPSDLVNVAGPGAEPLWKKRLPNGVYVPYDDRKSIDVGRSLAGRGLEIAYMSSLTDVLRLQTEGSGVLEVTENGSTKQYGVEFAGKNGRPYFSIFEHLRQKGVDHKYLSFAGLKQYFADFPDQVWPTLISNPSYTFFSLTEEPPCGAARVYLTAGHSIAVDPSRLPLGMATFFKAERPADESGKSVAFTRFGIAQDVGGAIKGAHVDVYWGTGEYAQLGSDSMKSEGALYIMRIK